MSHAASSADLRPLTALDAAALAATHAQCFEKPWAERDFRHWLARNDVIGLGVALEANTPLIGFGLLLNAGQEADLVTIAVEPVARGAGLGRRLLSGLIAAAEAAGVERIVLEVAADNIGAAALYNALGFTRIGMRRAYYPRQAGPAVDAHLMAKGLQAGL